MTGINTIGIWIVLSIVLLAGCSSVLPGEDAGPVPGEDSGTGTPTPGQDLPATPTATPESKATPTPTATPTARATATPVPGYLDYERYGEEIAEELNNYRGEEEWAEGFGNHSRDGVGVIIAKPEGWTVQDAEMEGAREVARLSALLGRNTVQEAKEDGVFVRPKTFQVHVYSQNGTFLSRVTIDSDTAAAYANNETTLKQYAIHVANSRSIHEEAHNGITISEREPTLALRTAEYRPFRKIHLHRVATSHPFGHSGDDVVPEIEKTVSVPEEQTLYYEYTVEADAHEGAQSAQVTRTYLETIKEVSEMRRVNRLPTQMVLYQNNSAYKDESIVTTAKTRWAFAYFMLSDWTLPQNKTMTEREWDAYNNRVNLNKKYIEDDDNYDPLNETVRTDD